MKIASVLADAGWCSRSRRISFGGRPRPDQARGEGGGLSRVHIDVRGIFPAAQVSPSAVTPERSFVSAPYPVSIRRTPRGKPALHAAMSWSKASMGLVLKTTSSGTPAFCRRAESSAQRQIET
jgi:hypothetical protein